MQEARIVCIYEHTKSKESKFKALKRLPTKTTHKVEQTLAKKNDTATSHEI